MYFPKTLLMHKRRNPGDPPFFMTTMGDIPGLGFSGLICSNLRTTPSSGRDGSARSILAQEGAGVASSRRPCWFGVSC